METRVSISSRSVRPVPLVLPVVVWTSALFCVLVAMTGTVPEPWLILAICTMASGLAAALVVEVPLVTVASSRRRGPEVAPRPAP